MRRRQLLVTALSAVSFTGCMAPSGSPDDASGSTDSPNSSPVSSETDDPSPTNSPSRTAHPTQSDPITPDPDDPIAVVLSNGTDETLTVQVTVRSGGSVLLDRTETVGPDDRPKLDTGISETGDYELVVAVVDGPSETRPFDVERYDLRMGSNLIVEISADEILVLMEE